MRNGCSGKATDVAAVRLKEMEPDVWLSKLVRSDVIGPVRGVVDVGGKRGRKTQTRGVLIINQPREGRQVSGRTGVCLSPA